MFLYSANANFYCWYCKYPTLLGQACTCRFPLICLGFWLAGFTYGFWKYLVCSAGFGLYFCSEKLLQFPHFSSRILFFLIKITFCKNSDNSYTEGCWWKWTCVYLEESVTFCLIYYLSYLYQRKWKGTNSLASLDPRLLHWLLNCHVNEIIILMYTYTDAVCQLKSEWLWTAV